MKKAFSVVLALLMVLSVCTFASAEGKDYSGYTIRIYSNSNSTERATWLENAAKAAGFTISLDDNSVISGDTAAIQAANENKDGDIIFGLNETRWSQLVNGTYENLKVMDWTPTWADEVGEYKYDGKATRYLRVNVLMLYRTDELGTNGEKLSFEHWADIVDCGYTWYRQGKVGGTTNSNINSAMLRAISESNPPRAASPWKAGRPCGTTAPTASTPATATALIRSTAARCRFLPSTPALSTATWTARADSSEHPLLGTLEPENWALVDIADGTYYIAEYLGILDREGRTPEETEAVVAFAEWFGSADTQAEWADEFDSFPCNTAAVAEIYDETPAIYTLKNFALETVEGTDMTYAEYVGAHSSEWTNIMTNLGFYWADNSAAPTEPDWDNLDWSVLTQAAGE